MKVEVGDEILTAPCIFHEGVDIGNRLAKVISTKGYILVNVHDYAANPVKLMQNEVVEVVVKWSEIQKDMEEFDRLFSDIGP